MNMNRVENILNILKTKGIHQVFDTMGEDEHQEIITIDKDVVMYLCLKYGYADIIGLTLGEYWTLTDLLLESEVI